MNYQYIGGNSGYDIYIKEQNEKEINYNFNNEYLFRGGKNFAALYQIQQNYLKQLEKTEE
jgi:hypothetical protein